MLKRPQDEGSEGQPLLKRSLVLEQREAINYDDVLNVRAENEVGGALAINGSPPFVAPAPLMHAYPAIETNFINTDPTFVENTNQPAEHGSQDMTAIKLRRAGRFRRFQCAKSVATACLVACIAVLLPHVSLLSLPWKALAAAAAIGLALIIWQRRRVLIVLEFVYLHWIYRPIFFGPKVR